MDSLTTHYAHALRDAGQDPLVLMPLTILDFLCIHPFSGGSGRVARLLTLLLLYHVDYEVGRYIRIERVYEDTKDSYYETLETSSKGWRKGRHDRFPWLEYFWGVLLRAYRYFEERVGEVRKGRGATAVRSEVEDERPRAGSDPFRRNTPFHGSSNFCILRMMHATR